MNKLLNSAFLSILFLGIQLTQANIFLDAAQVQVDRIIDKKPAHKLPIEFKQAVARYVKNVEATAYQNISLRNSDENAAYKKELRYLFKNYGKFSAASLLSRLRSAHQTMLKQDSDMDEDVYQRYEHISSALLLVCTQVFFNETRNQILHALHEIDNLIVYWRYQQNHQVQYFFSKSPIKWIVGKDQEKEIIGNISKLERKQRELYTLLGAITDHAHSFTEMGLAYDDAYSWIERLFEIVSCIKTTSSNNDSSRFDRIAGQLELKLKRIHKFKDDCMSSLKFAKKPSHFTRNWVAYVTLLSVSAYLLHYHNDNPDILPKNLERLKVGVMGAVTGMIIDPMTDLWKVFFDITPETSVSSIEKRATDIEKYADIIQAKVNQLTKQEIDSLRAYSLKLAEQVLSRMQDKNFVVDKEQIMVDLYQDDLKKLSELIEKTSMYHYDEKIDLGIANILLMIDRILYYLQKYPEVIDNGILPLLQEIGFLFGDLGNLIAGISKNHYWTARLSAFAPMAAICFGANKTYKWATTHDYSPIRIALADVNSLLIESVNNIDDHDYGKLVYLVSKLRHKTVYLKDSLAGEFLNDVAKLESKQYSPQTKRGIVENMFNKYAFLGKISI